MSRRSSKKESFDDIMKDFHPEAKEKGAAAVDTSVDLPTLGVYALACSILPACEFFEFIGMHSSPLPFLMLSEPFPLAVSLLQ